MTLLTIARIFARNESGAINAEWLLPTAAVIGLGLSLLTSVSGASADISQAAPSSTAIYR